MLDRLHLPREKSKGSEPLPLNKQQYQDANDRGAVRISTVLRN